MAGQSILTRIYEVVLERGSVKNNMKEKLKPQRAQKKPLCSQKELPFSILSFPRKWESSSKNKDIWIPAFAGMTQ